VLAGQPVTYTLSAHNAGPSTAINVQVTDNLPSGVELDSTTPSQGSCSEDTGTIT